MPGVVQEDLAPERAESGGSPAGSSRPGALAPLTPGRDQPSPWGWPSFRSSWQGQGMTEWSPVYPPESLPWEQDWHCGGGGAGHRGPFSLGRCRPSAGQLLPFPYCPPLCQPRWTPCPGSDILPNPMTASWSRGGPRLPVEPSGPWLGALAPRLLAAQPPRPPRCEGDAGSWACGPECGLCCPRGCMRLGIRRGACSLRPVIVTPGPSLQASKVQLRRPLPPFTGRGPDGAHDILFGCKTWRSKNP